MSEHFSQLPRDVTRGRGRGDALKRFLPLAAAGVCALLMASSAPAGALNGGITPGHLQSAGIYGFGDASDAYGGTDFSASVTTGLITFKPRKPSGPLITIPTNMVNLSLNSGGVWGSGCWLIPPSDVIVNSDLSATLTFDSADPRVTQCPGDPVGTMPLGAAPGRPADGLVQGIVGELKATMTWTPASPVVSNRSTVKETCGAFASTSEGSQRGSQSTVSASVVGTVEGWSFWYQRVVDIPVNATLTGGFGDMNTSTYQLNVHGPATGRCGQFGAP